MKKFFALIMALVLVACFFVGCTKTEEPKKSDVVTPSQNVVESENTNESEQATQSEETTTSEQAQQPTEGETIRLGALKGPTTMGLVKLLDDSENNLTVNKYDFQMSGAADELTPKFLTGELDMLALPANVASVLYNKSNGAAQVVAINTLGVIYIVEKGGDTVHSIADLKGKSIISLGKGSTPEYALNYLMTAYGLNPATDITVDWKSEASEAVAAMATMDHAIAMLPQPFVTVAKTQFEDLKIQVSLTEAWDALNNGSTMITATVIVRSEFAENHPEAVKQFLTEYKASTDWVNANVEEAAALIEKLDIVKAAVAKQAIPYCNIVCITGSEMKTKLSGYLQVLFEQNAQAVGGAMPQDNFYLIYE